LLNGIHTVARLRYILGEVAVVYMGEHKGPSFSREDVEGTMSGLLTLESGVHVWVLQSPETRLRGVFSGFRLHGEEGSVIATDERYAFLGNEAVGADPLEWHGFPDAELSSYALELLAFRQAVAGRAIGPTTGESERRSLSVVQAGYESAASGKPIHLRERFGPL